jgi:hypothetical protein
MLSAIQVKGCHQILWCCNHPKDQTSVGSLTASVFHPLHFYHHEPPKEKHTINRVMLQKANALIFKSQNQKLCMINGKISRITYHNHDTFMEHLLRNKHPKDVIQERTTEKNCTHLIYKTYVIHFRRKTTELPEISIVLKSALSKLMPSDTKPGKTRPRAQLIK